MDCKIIDRANKRLAKQHEEIERLCAELYRLTDRDRVMSQTENNLPALCRAQTKDLKKCQHQRDNVLLALRAIIGAIEVGHDYRPSYAVREIEILAIAKKGLEAE